MLYLDYSRKAGEWMPNQLRRPREPRRHRTSCAGSTSASTATIPDAVTIAEESTAWPMVSRPTYLGGLGFGFKWDMGWMHDTLDYLAHDPIHRKYHHNELTFRMLYAFTENYVLPLSHDEVVHGKGSLLSQDAGRRLAEVRQPAAAVRLHVRPAGQEAAVHGRRVRPVARVEPRRQPRLAPAGIAAAPGAAALGARPEPLYRGEPALHELDCDPAGFEWVDCHDAEPSVISFLRKGKATGDCVLVVCNFTPVPRHGYRVGVPHGGRWEEVLNSDAPHLRRQRPGQPRRRRGRPRIAGTAATSCSTSPAAAGHGGVPARRQPPAI